MSDSEAQAIGAADIKSEPGAPSNRDWDEVSLENPTEEDQATDLPESGTLKCPHPVPILKEREDFDGWLDAVDRFLRPNNLHRLVDATIQRPLRNAPNAERWRKLSQRIRAWLVSRMDAKVVQGIMARGGRVTFADEFMTETRKFILNEGHDALSAAILKFIKTTRSQFNSTEEFITALKLRYQVTSDRKGQIPPYTAVIIMFQELQSVPELSRLINIWNDELCLVKNPAANITHDEFLKYTSAILNELKPQSASQP